MNHIKEFYNKYGINEWLRLEKSLSGKVEYLTNMHFIKLQFPPSGKIIDVGCGPGRYSIALAHLGYEMTLVDISPKQLLIAKQKIEENNVNNKIDGIIEASIVDLGAFSDETFDGILSLASLMYLSEEEDRKKAVSEMTRVLKKGGIIQVSVNTIGSILGKIFNPSLTELIKFEGCHPFRIYEGNDKTPKFHFFLVDELKSVFERENLKIIRLASIFPFYHISKLDNYGNSEVFETLVKILIQISECRGLLECGKQLMVQCKKV